MALDFNPFEKDNEKAIQKQQEKKIPTRIKVFEKNNVSRNAINEKSDTSTPQLNESRVIGNNSKDITEELRHFDIPSFDIPQNEVCQNEIAKVTVSREILKTEETNREQYPSKQIEVTDIKANTDLLASQYLSKTHSAIQIPQNKVPYFEVPQNDIPQNKVPQNNPPINRSKKKNTNEISTNLGINYGGYFPLRCSFFSPELFLKLNEGETKILLYLSFLSWRYGAKFGGARASVSYISKGTGISESTVNRHLKNLLKSGLIEQMKTDMRNGNVYKITQSLVYFDISAENQKNDIPQNDIPQNDIPQIKVPQNNIEGMPKSHKTSVILTDQVCQNDIEDLTLSILSKSLSLSKFLNPTQLAELEARWMSFMKKEREREEKGLLKLFEQKPDEAATLFKAFDIVLKEQEEYGEIKSAISVLETNYSGQYRAKAIAAIARSEQKEKENQVKAETGAKQQEAEDAEGEMQLIRMQCFQEAFPDIAMRKQYILNICKESAVFSKFTVTSPIAVSHAVARWAEGEGSARVLNALDRQTSSSPTNSASKEEQ